MRQYSSNAHCDFSCSDSMWATSDKPQASASLMITKIWLVAFNLYLAVILIEKMFDMMDLEASSKVPTAIFGKPFAD